MYLIVKNRLLACFVHPRTCLQILRLPLLFIVSVAAYAQQNYPVPPASANRLFYIQHSNNFNTYVYDARMAGNALDKNDPVDEYRIVYTEGGVKKPLTKIQKSMAYGILVNSLGTDFYEMHLAGSSKLKMYLVLHGSPAVPKVYATINNQKMYLHRIFLQLKEGYSGLEVKAEYVLFEGNDFENGEAITEKVVIE